MSSMMVEIIIEGLIALMPHAAEGDPATNRMTALVVKTPDPVVGECLVAHTPKIKFFSTARECSDQEESLGCEFKSSKHCICDLHRLEIDLKSRSNPDLLSETDPDPTVFSRERPQPLPFDYSDAGDFRYVADFFHLGRALDPSFLGPSPGDSLAARFEFPFDSLLACRLATRPDDLSHNVHTMRFRQSGKAPEREDLLQAVAQQLIASVSLDLSGPDDELVLVLRQLDGDQSFEFTLKHGRMWLMNHRSEPPLAWDDPCNDGVGRDFSFYYELTQDPQNPQDPPPPLAERKRPHVKHTQFKSFTDIDPPACESFKGPLSRPICPLASVPAPTQ